MERIPFTVIGGYLGAGKTTLLNHMLRHNDGRRSALLVNDFGSINIDAELIENQDGETINLANGCVCCSLAGGFILGIDTLLKLDPLPDHIIVEASGVADTRQVGQYGNMPGLYLDGVVIVADAELVRQNAQDKYVGKTVMQQLKSADILILNKSDLVGDQQRKDLRDWLAHIAPQSTVISAQYGAVPFEFLVGSRKEQEFKETPERSDIEHRHDTEFTSWSFVNDVPIQRQPFEQFLTGLPESVVRAKGILNLREDPAHRTIFQLVGRRWKLTRDTPWGDEKPQSRIVWIGFKDDSDDMKRQLLDLTSIHR